MAFGANTRGAAWLVAGGFLITVMLVLVKYLEGRFSPFQIAFVRAGLSSLALIPVIRRVGAAGFRARRPLLLLLRSAMATLSIALAFYAISHMRLADVQAISFANILFMVPLAALILGERIGPRRWGAAIAGFIGVLIILRPGAEMSLAALAALGSALLLAATVVTVKVLSKDMPPTPLFLYGTILMAAFSGLPALLVWTPPSPSEWGVLAGVALFGAGAQYCRVRAVAAAETSAIAPLDYLRLLFAVAAGFMLFGETPDAFTWLGAGVIVAATLYITWREAQLARRGSSAKPAAAAHEHSS